LCCLPQKTKQALLMDVGLGAMIQFATLCYGVSRLWKPRSLHLKHEFDRFEAVSVSDLRGATADHLPDQMQPNFFKNPRKASLRTLVRVEDKNKILMDTNAGGADFGERSDFFVPFVDNEMRKTCIQSKSLNEFLLIYRDQRKTKEILAIAHG
jgi:hypothetical protein